MNYKRIYDSLIFCAKCRSLDGYKERHHIIPKSLGGSDDISNIVELTPREHYICHWLLTKLQNTSFDSYKAGVAFFMMSKSNHGRRKFSSKAYSRAKSKFSSLYKKFLISEEGQIFLKTRAKKRIDNQQEKFIFHFWHPEYGAYFISGFSLMKLFPEQKLNSSNLVKVGQEKRNEHKGWRLYKNAKEDFFSIRRERMSISARQRSNKNK